MNVKKWSIFLLLIAFIGNPSKSINLDSLYAQLDTTTVDSIKTRTQLALANHYFYVDTDSARKYLYQFVNFNQNILENAHATSKIGVCFAFDTEFDSALVYMNRAMDIFLKENDSLNIAYSYNSVGLVHINTGNYEKGVEMLIESIKWKETLADSYPPKKLMIGSTYMNIGIGLQSLGRFEKALEYYREAELSSKKEQNVPAAYMAKVQIANLYSEIDSVDLAIPIYQEVLDRKVFEQNAYTIVKVYNNYGATLMAAERNSEAEDVFKKALEINRALGINYSICKNLNNLGNLYLQTNEYSKSIQYLKEAIALGDSIGDLNIQYKSSLTLAEAYEKSGQFKQSVAYYKKGNALSDSISKDELNKTVADLESKFQLEKKQQTIKDLETQNHINDLEIRRKNAMNLLFGVVLVVGAIALLIVLYILGKLRKQRTLLNDKNVELARLNDSLNMMFAIISHDLRNLISGFKGSGDLVAYYLQKDETVKLKELANNLSVNASRLEILLNNLLNWAISQGEIYSPTPEKVNVHETVKSLVDLNKPNAHEKGITIENTIDSSIFVYADSNNLSFILRNLLSNALKFTRKGWVKFAAEKGTNTTKIIIEDTGVGIKAEKLKEIFELNKEKKSVGTAGEKGTGLGLKLVYDFVQLNKGKISIKSNEGEGTTVIVELPNTEL